MSVHRSTYCKPELTFTAVPEDDEAEGEKEDKAVADENSTGSLPILMVKCLMLTTK